MPALQQLTTLIMAPTAKRPAGIPQHETEALLRLAQQYDVTELEVAWGESRVKIRRDRSGPPSSPPPAPAPTPHLLAIEAPMVGTFYRAPSPDAPPYVNEGDPVKEGQVLCIIEAMKLMNEIEAKMSGRVVKILADNGQPVEYGQPLFLIDPQS